MGTGSVGSTTIQGSADIAQFWILYTTNRPPGDTVWLPIQVGQQAVKNGDLGSWDTSSLAPGAYMLELVVTDNVGNALTPCAIQVTVEPAP